jgi:predicted small lipoprotein YifL
MVKHHENAGKKMKFILLVMLSFLILSGCGQFGNLYLPTATELPDDSNEDYGEKVA